jgi:hypothetical protein
VGDVKRRGFAGAKIAKKPQKKSFLLFVISVGKLLKTMVYASDVKLTPLAMRLFVPGLNSTAQFEMHFTI